MVLRDWLVHPVSQSTHASTKAAPSTRLPHKDTSGTNGTSDHPCGLAALWRSDRGRQVPRATIQLQKQIPASEQAFGLNT